MNNLIIGIAGGSGSGKTTLACRLKALFGEDEVRLISHDSYYKRHDELPFEERCKLNYDHPDAFDNALLIYHLQELKAGRAIDCPVYDYADHNRSNEVQHIEPAPVLIVEGILPFVEPELCAMFDYKIFVDTDADERILRRLVRDVKERGRSLDSVINQYLTTVKPMHEAFVEPSKRNADIIVPNGGENTTGISSFTAFKHIPKGQAVFIKDTENIITPPACHHEITAKPLWVVLCLFCVPRYINVPDFPTRLIRLEFDRCRIDIKNIGRQA